MVWLLAHPFALLAIYIAAEAGLPPRFQPSAWVLRGAIRVYQVTLSPILGTQCKFQPTCSHYGLGCIRKYGTLKGGVLTTWRILRCSPFTHGGDDPVP
ncbi:MAG TPA: membrane protein insertion efficiency factor YidD [Holophaga sp.]|nr:membrane protein insertion efficiency factor YidD [Holophaga sp.]